MEHTDYYQFFFYNQNITVHLMVGQAHEEDYSLFLLLKSLFSQYLEGKEIKLSDDEKELELIKL